MPRKSVETENNPTVSTTRTLKGTVSVETYQQFESFFEGDKGKIIKPNDVLEMGIMALANASPEQQKELYVQVVNNRASSVFGSGDVSTEEVSQ